MQEKIVPHIRAGESVMVAAHKNSLRALWKYLETLSAKPMITIRGVVYLCLFPKGTCKCQCF